MYRKISKEEKMFREKINEAKNVLYSRIYSGESPNVELEIDFLNDNTKMEPGYYAAEYNKDYGCAMAMREYEKPLLSLADAKKYDVNVAMSCNACKVAYCL